MIRRALPTYVVSPDHGSLASIELAHDVARALNGAATETQLVRAADLTRQPSRELERATLLLVNPAECALSGAKSVACAASAARRIAVLSESLNEQWYEKQLAEGLDCEGVIDIGFVPQAKESERADMFYRFVFDGPRSGESFPSPEARRAFPWAVVGRQTGTYVRLTEELVRRLSPRGFAFLPRIEAGEVAQDKLGARALDRVLARTELYIWCSADSPSVYYESIRFRRALRTGSVPVNIGLHRPTVPLPGVYSTLDDLMKALADRDWRELYREAVDYYAAGASLDEQLQSALRAIA